MKTKILFILIFSFVFFGLAKSSWAGCMGSSPTWTTTPDYASVAECVANADAGDTITISTGSATWATGVSIAKPLSIIGTGTVSLTTNTYILADGNANKPGFFHISDINSETELVRISNITFTYDVSPKVYNHSIITINNPRKIWKLQIDHCTFYGAYTAIFASGWMRGVIHDNTFIDNGFGSQFLGPRIGDSCEGSASWNDPASFIAGTENALFYEGNTFLITDPSEGYSEAIGTAGGGNLVVRYNTMDHRVAPNWHTTFMTHGSTDYSLDGLTCDGGRRGQPLVETYNNLIMASPTGGGMAIQFRGSSNIAYNNVTSGYSSNINAIELREEEFYSLPVFDPLRTAWPGQDQIFNSFFWNNTFNGTLSGVSGETSYIQEDRDYFLHAPQATGGKETFTGWAGGSNSAPTEASTSTMVFSSSGPNAYYPYTPYNCPHPLTGLTGSCDSAVAGATGYNITSGDITPPAAPQGLSVQ